LPETIPLQYLPAGRSGSIVEIDGDPQWVRRLDEMGLRRGVVVRMIQSGRPCIVAFDQSRISFRGEEAALVLVELIEQNPSKAISS
jgi:Fe2+ transport system protein FeoA